MNLVKFSPYRTVNQNLADQVLNNFLRNDYHEDYLKHHALRPATNIFETDNEFKVEILLPGYKKEDVQMAYHENVLTVKVELPENKEEKKQEYRYERREFSVYNFERKFRIPKTVDSDNISASFEN